MDSISKDIEKVAWNNNKKITAQEIINEVTEQLDTKYKHKDK